MARPTVSVVVHWPKDDLGSVSATIASLVAGSDAPEEIIVVESGRDPRLAMRLLGEWPMIVSLGLARNQGRGYALQCGARAARGEMILFLEAGTEVAAETLPRLVGYLGAHPEAVAAQPLVVVLSSDNFIHAAGACLTRNGWVVPHHYGGRASTATTEHAGPLPNEDCVLVRAHELTQAGGFDTFLFEAWCVADLGLRLLAAGGKIALVPEARAARPFTYPERAYLTRRARVRVAAKTLPLARLARVVATEALRDKYLSLRAILHRSFSEPRQLARKWLWLALRFPDAARQRRHLALWYRGVAAELADAAPERAPRLGDFPPPRTRRLNPRAMAETINLARPPLHQIGLNWEIPGPDFEALVVLPGATVFLPWLYPLLTPLGRVLIEGESSAPGRLEVEINGQVAASVAVAAGPVSIAAPLTDRAPIQRVSFYPMSSDGSAPPPQLNARTISIGWEMG